MGWKMSDIAKLIDQPGGYRLSKGVPAGSPNPVHILADDEVAVKRSAIQTLLGEVGE